MGCFVTLHPPYIPRGSRSRPTSAWSWMGFLPLGIYLPGVCWVTFWFLVPLLSPPGPPRRGLMEFCLAAAGAFLVAWVGGLVGLALLGCGVRPRRWVVLG